MAGGLRLVLALVSSLLMVATGAGCFDPVYREGLPCGTGRRCPGELVCSADRRCVDPDLPDAGVDVDRDAAVPDAGIDAFVRMDAFIATDAPRAQDASAVRCDPVEQDCGVSDKTCTFVATDIEKPYRGYLGCVNVEGAAQLGDPCYYVNPAPGGGFYDDCAFGLICGDQEGVCREPCTSGDTCGPTSTECQSMRDVRTVLSPYGLCYPSSSVDAGGPTPQLTEPAP